MMEIKKLCKPSYGREPLLRASDLATLAVKNLNTRASLL